MMVASVTKISTTPCDGISCKVPTETLRRAKCDGLIARHLDESRIETATLYERPTSAGLPTLRRERWPSGRTATGRRPRWPENVGTGFVGRAGESGAVVRQSATRG